MKKKTIYVTKPFLPPLEEFKEKLDAIWSTGHITNWGPIHEEFKEELKAYLHVKNISLFTNGHLALETAIKCLKLPQGGEIITTPFTFVSTSHAILNCGYTPVFCDICEDDFNMDHTKIADLITDKTVAILPVHVFGQPCNVHELQNIATKHKLKLIYDSAHAFNVKVDNNSIFNYGDISMASLHATKVMHSIEGGFLAYQDEKLQEKIRYLKNFGIANAEDVPEVGSNAKMNEFQASMGSVNLKYIDENIAKRKVIFTHYLKLLQDNEHIQTIALKDNIQYNFSYFPIVINTNNNNITRNGLAEYLIKNDIVPRKYFYPLISNLDNYKNYNRSANNLAIANKIANNILTLPIYPDLDLSDVERIVSIINDYTR